MNETPGDLCIKWSSHSTGHALLNHALIFLMLAATLCLMPGITSSARSMRLRHDGCSIARNCGRVGCLLARPCNWCHSEGATLMSYPA